MMQRWNWKAFLKVLLVASPSALALISSPDSLFVLAPVWHEPPSHQLQGIGAVPDNGSYGVSRSNVVAWLQSELLNLF